MEMEMNDQQDDSFGLCPICHRTDGYANAGKSHRFYCLEHRTSWYAGSNLFSSWREETEAEQRETWERIGLNQLQNVVPYHHPRPLPQLDGGEIDESFPF
jgi:hypothetical protein